MPEVKILIEGYLSQDTGGKTRPKITRSTHLEGA